MRFLIFIAALLATAVTVGHFKVGGRKNGDGEGSRAVFYQLAVFFVLSSIALLMMAFEARTGPAMRLLVRFVGIVMGVQAVVQFLVAKSEPAEVVEVFWKQGKGPDAVQKVTQWMMLAATALVTWISANPDELFTFH